MKLLLFSDLHADARAARRMVEMSRDVDVVIGAGDFATVRRRLNVCLEILRTIDKPTVFVAGNNETTDELRAACAGWNSCHILHGSGVRILDVDFFGIGGGIPITPFGSWSYDFSEADAVKLLASCPANAVLVSHSPPKGAVDASSSGQSLGSTAVRDVILRTQPRLVVCGHIHSCGGNQEMLGQTPVVNAGPVGIVWNWPTERSPANEPAIFG